MDEDSTPVLEGEGKTRGKDRRKKSAFLPPSTSSPPSPATSAPPSAPPSVLATGLLSLIPNVPLHVAARNESYLETGGREGGKEGGKEGGAVDDGIAGAQRELLEAQGAYLRRVGGGRKLHTCLSFSSLPPSFLPSLPPCPPFLVVFSGPT
ncbi:hypothetical protein Naga_102576g1 [Nannochloropsis gaditana]|uniref:Uncharacterized protein n=1 Tax=Nannochloropsis gaditana TaxID=72520 RepID=W7T911_9STRA|nr:hypothetical protein Naga_102576g1 [Nannochloropsis gaditana]